MAQDDYRNRIKSERTSLTGTVPSLRSAALPAVLGFALLSGLATWMSEGGLDPVVFAPDLRAALATGTLEYRRAQARVWLDASAAATASDPSGKTLARIAEAIAKHAAQEPTDGAAWFVVSAMALSVNGADAALPALRRSYAVAPNELWLIQWRIYLAMFLWPDLPADLKRNVTEDAYILANPVRGSWGIEALARAAALAGPDRIVAARAMALWVSEVSAQIFDNELAAKTPVQ